MTARKRVTEEEKKMAFEGIVPPGRTEEWRKYFVRRRKWEAKRKQSATESKEEKPEEMKTESVTIPAI